MSKPSLRAALNAGEFVLAPGIHDMIAAVISNKVGFDFVYGSGFWTTASAYGLPDAGIATYTQMLDRMATLTRTVRASVIADADTGYGGLLNVHHTVRGYEAAGVAAIQIEDQEFPKKCGHTPFKRVVPMIDMIEKVKVACEARANPEETIIIARTDARQTDGFEGAVKRGIAYGEAGADVVFVEALESEAEMREACARISKPMMANMADGGKTPIYSKTELAALGYKLAIFPSLTGLAAAAAVETSPGDAEIDRRQSLAGCASVRLPRIQRLDRLRGRVGVRTSLGARARTVEGLMVIGPTRPTAREGDGLAGSLRLRRAPVAGRVRRRRPRGAARRSRSARLPQGLRLLTTPQQEATGADVFTRLGELAAGLFTGAAMHTPIAVTERALAAFAAAKADCTVAIGGGSTTGLGKALALRTDLPQIVVPTTYAGSEMTPILGETARAARRRSAAPAFFRKR